VRWRIRSMSRSGSRRGLVSVGPLDRDEKLFEQLSQAGFILMCVEIHLAPGPFQVHIRHDGRAAMARPGDVEHVQVVSPDDTVQVDVNEVLGRASFPRARPPTASHVTASWAPSARGCREDGFARPRGRWRPASRRLSSEGRQVSSTKGSWGSTLGNRVLRKVRRWHRAVRDWRMDLTVSTEEAATAPSL